MALILETKATKDEILELYLNDVYLGHRGSFALHGVAEASKIFFSKDVRNLTLERSGADCRRHPVAVLSLAVQQPGARPRPPQRGAARDGRWRATSPPTPPSAPPRNRSPSWPAPSTTRRPTSWTTSASALDESFPGVTAKPGVLDIYTTLDLNLQRHAQDAIREGIATVDATLARRKRGPRRVAQAALVAIDPRTGEILSFIGGRSYNQSQFNRAANARRQMGSTFKPFVYLAAFEKAADEGTGDITPATIVFDEPTTWNFDDQEWSPRNYDGEYDGGITLRRALAMSRNIATVKVAEQTGYDKVVALWRKTKIGEQDQVKPYPSVALGVVELTPLEVAEAYTVFPNNGTIKKLRSIINVQERRAGHQAEGRGRAQRRAPVGGVPGHPHDAQRAERRHRRQRPRRGLHARRRRQVGHHQRPARRVVRRLHA